MLKRVIGTDIVISPPAGRLSHWRRPPTEVARRNGGAKRSRRSRAQDKLGIVMLEVPVFYDRLVEALIVSNNLTEAEALVRGNVVAAAAEIIADWFHLCPADVEILRSASRVTRGRRNHR